MTLNEFLVLARTAKRVAMTQEFALNGLEPMSVFSALRITYKEAMILENLAPGADQYSLIAYRPFASLKAFGKEVRVQVESETSVQTISPILALRQRLQDFAGNTIGLLSYDAVRVFERIPDRHPKSELPDMAFFCYRNTLYFDYSKKVLLVTIVIDAGADPHAQYAKAMQEIARTKAMLDKIAPESFPLDRKRINLPVPDTDVSDDAFKTMVARAKDYIQRGDAFQIVLSRTFLAPVHADPVQIYRALRANNRAPYLFYLPVDDAIAIGASPETLVSVRDGEVSVHPIAGTRPRLDKNQEQAIEKELLCDEKEIAEHMMLVDLARNDVGKIAVVDSVKVTKLLKVKHYADISHITSTVSGQLRPEYDALDALGAAFPAGTLTGAPKIRAMEIIDALESSRRGLYGGAICRLYDQGNLDSGIAIRMAVIKDNIASIRAGAGIVADSDPDDEAAETRHKARAMLAAIAVAEAKKTR